jgi:hypothetical protein
MQKMSVRENNCLLTKENNDVAAAVISNSDLYFAFPAENILPTIQSVCPLVVHFFQNIQKQLHFSLEVKNKITQQIQSFLYTQTLLFSNGFFIFDMRKIRI